MRKDGLVGVGAALLTLSGAASADPVCDELHSLALMPRATVATHLRGVDPDGFDESQKLTDLTLFGEPCGAVAEGDDVAEVECQLELADTATPDSFFDAVDECLKDSAMQISRDPGEMDHIWVRSGAMVKMWIHNGKQLHITFVY